MKHVGIDIKFYNLDTFKKQTDVNFIDLDSELVDLNYKVASLIFCRFWRSMWSPCKNRNATRACLRLFFSDLCPWPAGTGAPCCGVLACISAC